MPAGEVAESCPTNFSLSGEREDDVTFEVGSVRLFEIPYQNNIPTLNAAREDKPFTVT